MLTIEYLESTEKSPIVLTKRWPLANDFGAYPFYSIIDMCTFWFVFFPPKSEMAICMSWTWFLNYMWLMVFHFINQSSMFWMTIIRKIFKRTLLERMANIHKVNRIEQNNEPPCTQHLISITVNILPFLFYLYLPCFPPTPFHLFGKIYKH